MCAILQYFQHFKSTPPTLYWHFPKTPPTLHQHFTNMLPTLYNTATILYPHFPITPSTFHQNFTNTTLTLHQHWTKNHTNTSPTSHKRFTNTLASTLHQHPTKNPLLSNLPVTIGVSCTDKWSIIRTVFSTIFYSVLSTISLQSHNNLNQVTIFYSIYTS